MRKTVGELGYLFIPELCELLKQEHPEYTNIQIQDQVTDDCCDIWERSSIYVYLPSWVHNQAKVAAAKKAWETKESKKLKACKNVFTELSSVSISEPRLPQPKERFTEVDEELDKELHGLGLGKFGETNKSIRELYGDITEAAGNLFKAMSQHDIPYSDDEDLIVDHIKPTREFWRSLMLEFDEVKRTRVHNWLSYIVEMAEDRLEILKQIEK